MPHQHDGPALVFDPHVMFERLLHILPGEFIGLDRPELRWRVHGRRRCLAVAGSKYATAGIEDGGLPRDNRLIRPAIDSLIFQRLIPILDATIRGWVDIEHIDCGDSLPVPEPIALRNQIRCILLRRMRCPEVQIAVIGCRRMG